MWKTGHALFMALIVAGCSDDEKASSTTRVKDLEKFLKGRKHLKRLPLKVVNVQAASACGEAVQHFLR